MTLPASTASDETLMVALGPRRYRVERPWGMKPTSETVGMWAAVACDSRDRVYVYQRFDRLADRQIGPAILVFGKDGTFVGHWGRDLIKDAHHLFIDKKDRVFLVDRDAHQVVVCDTDGQLLFTLGERDGPGRPFNHPTSVTVGPKGDIYVADGYGATYVHRFGPDGQHIRTWGGLGKGKGDFLTPHGIGCLSDGRVLVGDRENDRVQVFDADGSYLSEITGFYHPMSIYVDGSDIVHVSDQIPRVTALDKGGALVGMCRPVLNGGHGVFGDSMGNLYFAESRPNRITRLTLQVGG
jgi:peptidylglycine monooxygenase